MTLHQYNALDDHEQEYLLLIHGVCIRDQVTDDAHFLLFQLHSFYVEISFAIEGDEILSCRTFDNIDELEPYLQQMNILESFETHQNRDR